MNGTYKIGVSNHAIPVLWVQNEQGCHVVVSHTISSNGYPKIGIAGTQKNAARAVWEFLRGPIDDGIVVRHKCDNPTCINLDHLELGTQLQNIQDAVERGRWAKGSKHGRSKINEETVMAIRSTEGTLKMVANKFNVSIMLVSLIRRRKIWRHVP